MNFNDLVNDIEKLVGIELDSIRPGATIRILDIDYEKNCLTLRNNQGQIKSRPLSELQIIWSELVKNPAVHVEGVLHGSGTSRNQPETIMANLPYIEWLKVSNKKHISYVGKQTHAFGTLREMDAVRTADVISALNAKQTNNNYTAVIVTSDIGKTTEVMTASTPGKLSMIVQGVYKYESGNACVLFVSSSLVNIKEGTYCVLDATEPTENLPRVTICNTTFALIEQNNIFAFLIAEETLCDFSKPQVLLSVAEDASDEYRG